MEKRKVLLSQQEKEGQESAASQSPDKKPWQEPKLSFVKPKLTKHGELKELTGINNGFFGPFSP